MLRRLFALVLLVSTFASASAQFGGLQIPNVEYNPLLLINPQVQKELHMPPSQASKVQAAFFQQAVKLAPYAMGGAPQGSRPLTQAEKTKLLYKGIDLMQRNLAAMLSAPQRNRLRQPTLQSIGPSAVLQPRVATALGLTSAQRSRLETDLTEANQSVADGFRNDRSVTTVGKRMGSMATLMTQAKAKGNRVLAAVLTKPQQAKWRAMLGQPANLAGFLGAGPLDFGMSGH